MSNQANQLKRKIEECQRIQSWCDPIYGLLVMDDVHKAGDLMEWIGMPEFCASSEIREQLDKWLRSQYDDFHDKNSILCHDLLEGLRCVWLCILATTPTIVEYLTSSERLQTNDYAERAFRVKTQFIPHLCEELRFAYETSPDAILDIPAKARHHYLVHVGLPLPASQYLPQSHALQ